MAQAIDLVPWPQDVCPVYAAPAVLIPLEPKKTMLAGVKGHLYHPFLPTLRRMDMDTMASKLTDEHSRTSTPFCKEDFENATFTLAGVPNQRLPSLVSHFHHHPAKWPFCGQSNICSSARANQVSNPQLLPANTNWATTSWKGGQPESSALRGVQKRPSQHVHLLFSLHDKLHLLKQPLLSNSERDRDPSPPSHLEGPATPSLQGMTELGRRLTQKYQAGKMAPLLPSKNQEEWPSYTRAMDDWSRFVSTAGEFKLPSANKGVLGFSCYAVRYLKPDVTQTWRYCLNQNPSLDRYGPKPIPYNMVNTYRSFGSAHSRSHYLRPWR